MDYLTPATGPVYAEALDDALHDMIAGMIGQTDGSKVRPRWQLEPANMLDFSTDWTAFGVSRTERDVFSFTGFDPSGETADFVLQRDEKLYTLVSFYGPNGSTFAHLYCDQLQVPQNRQAARLGEIKTGVVETQDPINVSLQIKEKWVVRWDVMTVLRRRIERRYPTAVPIEQVILGLDNEYYISPIEVTENE